MIWRWVKARLETWIADFCNPLDDLSSGHEQNAPYWEHGVIRKLQSSIRKTFLATYYVPGIEPGTGCSNWITLSSVNSAFSWEENFSMHLSGNNNVLLVCSSAGARRPRRSVSRESILHIWAKPNKGWSKKWIFSVIKMVCHAWGKVKKNSQGLLL